MPTSLPLTYSMAIIAPAKSSPRPYPVWFVMIWAAAILLFKALADIGPGEAAVDTFQLLAF